MTKTFKMGDPIEDDETAAALLDTAASALDNIRLSPVAMHAYAGVWDEEDFQKAAAVLRDASLVIRDQAPIGAPIGWTRRIVH